MATQYRGYPTVPALATADGRANINALAAAVDADVAGLARGYRLLTTVYLTSTGSFTKANYPGLALVEVECLGAGGGSGCSVATSTNQYSWGAGGAGGGWSHSTFLAGDLTAVETVTVGAGGVAGATGVTPSGPSSPTRFAGQGGNGGKTSFGSHVEVDGGDGGGVTSAVAVTAFGIPSGTSQDTTANGGDGVTGTYDLFVAGYAGDIFGARNGEPFTYWALHGQPGAGPYGTRTRPTASPGSGAAGIAGNGYGSGAAGSHCVASESTRTGAAGSNGLVIVRVYVGAL